MSKDIEMNQLSLEKRTQIINLLVEGNSLRSCSSLTEKRGNKNSSESFLKDLVGDHEAIIIQLRENVDAFANKYKDSGTSDFITGLMEEHEKMAWMLRAHLK